MSPYCLLSLIYFRGGISCWGSAARRNNGRSVRPKIRWSSGGTSKDHYNYGICGWVHDTFGATNLCRFGRLVRMKLPNTIKTLACLEAFYVLMLDVKLTLKEICNHTNDVALAHARIHRKKRIENKENEKNEKMGKAIIDVCNKKNFTNI
ncbi:hypothetical protein G9A89_017864 [Geosiphon pyriformis]|nr:hypothetical protein G9A89_017864 [Geosiphon pyriformis]